MPKTPDKPKLTAFEYHGPVNAISLELSPAKAGTESKADEPAERLELVLHPGKTAELPEDHPYVQGLVEQGLLTLPPEPDEPATAQAPAPKGAGKATANQQKEA
jgi:hypothetical protein